MVGDEVGHHKVIVYQIGLQTEGTKESAEAVEPSRRATEHTVQHHNQRDGKRYVYHTLYKQGESSV